MSSGPGAPVFDPYFTAVLSPFGHSRRLDRLQDHVLSLLAQRISDAEAIVSIRSAAGNQQLLSDMASMIERQVRPMPAVLVNPDWGDLPGPVSHGRWDDDPLVRHVAELVLAASAGDDPPPLTAEEAAITEQERRLLAIPLADAFAVLASRSEHVGRLANRVSDPAWQTAARADPSSDLPPSLNFGHPPLMARLMMWPMKRDARFKAFHDMDRETRRVWSAVGREIGFLWLRASPDMLLRTDVAAWVLRKHLETLAGLDLPSTFPL